MVNNSCYPYIFHGVLGLVNLSSYVIVLEGKRRVLVSNTYSHCCLLLSSKMLNILRLYYYIKDVKYNLLKSFCVLGVLEEAVQDQGPQLQLS